MDTVLTALHLSPPPDPLCPPASILAVPQELTSTASNRLPCLGFCLCSANGRGWQERRGVGGSRDPHRFPLPCPHLCTQPLLKLSFPLAWPHCFLQDSADTVPKKEHKSSGYVQLLTSRALFSLHAGGGRTLNCTACKMTIRLAKL